MDLEKKEQEKDIHPVNVMVREKIVQNENLKTANNDKKSIKFSTSGKSIINVMQPSKQKNSKEKDYEATMEFQELF